MSDEHKNTGTGWPESGSADTGREPEHPAVAPAAESSTAADADGGVASEVETVARAGDAAPAQESATRPPKRSADAESAAEAEVDDPASAGGTAGRWGFRRPGSAGMIIGLLLVLLGFTFIVQVKSTSTDSGLDAAREQDLVRILSDLDSRERRLRQEIASLEESERRLRSGALGRQAALEAATRRADELGILAGTLPARGPGLSLRFTAGTKPIRASSILDGVQELRGAGAEAMQIDGADGGSIRIVASTYFLDGDRGGLVVDGQRLSGPYTILVVGDPTTMRTALNIPGGVVASVKGDGGNVIVQEREVVDVSALSEPTDLEYARPVS